MKFGERPVNIVDVAREAGVSLGTVSNAMNRPEKVSPATRKRVEDAIATLGFVRNEAARSLRSGRARTIGLIVLDVANPFFTDMSQGVEEAAAEYGLSVLLCNSAQLAEREARHLALLEEQRVHGILISPVTQQSKTIHAMRKRGVHIVLVDRGSEGRQCSVSVDDVAGGALAVAHLLGLGHRRVAVVGGPRSLAQVSDRLIGSRNAMEANGLDADALTVIDTDSLTVASGRSAGQALLAMPARRRPTAAFCLNDLLALGLLQAMTAAGASVPGDMAIVGYDDIDFAAAAAVPLSSVRQPRAELGRAATELLLDEADSPTRHRHRQVVFSPELIERTSTVGGAIDGAAATATASNARAGNARTGAGRAGLGNAGTKRVRQSARG